MSSNREEVVQLDQSYGAIVKRQFLKNRPAVWSMRLLIGIIFIGLFADFIANDKPLYCKVNGKSYFPIFKSYAVNLGVAKWPKDLLKITDWRHHEYEKVVRTIIPYSAETRDKYNAQFIGPFAKQRLKSPKWYWKHRLGTDDIGRDVLSGMIHGTRIAMLVGLISMGIASIIGIFFGAIMGYFGDDKLKLSRGRLWLNLIFVIVAYFYAFIVRKEVVADAFNASFMSATFQILISIAVFILVMLIPNLIAIALKKIPFFAKKVSFPVDLVLMRVIEVLRSIPGLLLILAVVAAISKSSIFIVMAIIGVLGWTGIARFVRGEMLRVRSLEYIEASEALGFKRGRIIFKHALPNSLTPVLIAIAFGIAGAILTESMLSFLGIGVPPETITWGKLLSLGRTAPEAWWLAIFPGFAIFITVTIFNLLGDGLADAIDPKLKQ